MKGWLTCFHECVLTPSPDMSGPKSVSPLDGFLFFLVGPKRRVWQDAGTHSSPYHLPFSPGLMQWSQNPGCSHKG